jgi:integrase
MATATLLVMRAKEKNGTVPIYLQLNHKDKIRRISLGLRVPEADWNRGKKRARKTHDHHSRINEHLARVEAVAQEQIVKLKTQRVEPTARRMKEEVKRALDGGGDEQSFIDFARREQEAYDRRGQHATYNRHGQWIDKLERFAAKHGLSEFRIADLRAELIEDFRTFLIETDKLAQNTVAKHLKGMRTFVYKAMRAGRFPQSENPFFHITISETPGQKEKLSAEEFQKLVAAELEGELGLARDFFCFSVYAQGIRFADQVLLRRRNIRGNRLEYTMRKNGKHKSIKLVPPAGIIVDRYLPEEGGEDDFVFPYVRGYSLETDPQELSATSSRNAVYNETLKEVAKKVGIRKNLTAHVARHTFSNLALDEEWSLKKLQAALGHSTISATEHYIKQLKDHDLDDDMDGLFS